MPKATRWVKRMIMADMITHPITIIATIAIIMTMVASTRMASMVTTIMITITATPMLMTANKPSAGAGERGLDESEAASLYRLMTWLSPAFPVGAFSYSSGIEWAVEAGDIVDAASLREWLASMLAEGAGLCDGIFLAETHRAASSDDEAGLGEVARLASAFVSSRERHLETMAQGKAFVEIARAAWPGAALDRLIAACDGAIAYPVAVGVVSVAHAIPLAPTLHAFLHALTSNWISAGTRLVPLGQTDSQRLIAQLEVVVAATAKRALSASLDDLGSATFRADLASMQHEAQYTRLFRS